MFWLLMSVAVELSLWLCTFKPCIFFPTQAPIAVRLAKEAMNRGVEVSQKSFLFLIVNQLSVKSCLFQVDMNTAMAIERMCYARVRALKLLQAIYSTKLPHFVYIG